MPVTIQSAGVKPETFNFEAVQSTTSVATLFPTSTSVAAKAKKEKYEKLLARPPNSYSYDLDNPDAAGPPPPYKERCWRVQMNDAPKGDLVPNKRVVKAGNGFVHTLVKAYNEHHHLVIRPDDVWHAILAQFSLYVRAHAEELREKFVAHEGKKELVVTGLGNMDSADFGSMARLMSAALEDNLKDPSLRSWIIPDFSTSTLNDVTVASVFMMATMQQYFDYKFDLWCGIPSVTLLGTVEDWQSLRARIDKLDQYGEECKRWADLLREVCDSFVLCFDPHHEPAAKRFWSRVCHYLPYGSGSRYLCGWSTVFTVFDKDGKWQDAAEFKYYSKSETKGIRQWPMLDDGDVTSAITEVPVLVDDHGTEHGTLMLAGLPGMRVSKNKDGEYVLSPAVGWAMFEPLPPPA